MGLFDEIEREAQKQIEQQGGIDKVANQAETPAGGKNSRYGKLIDEGKGLDGDVERGQKPRR